MGVSLPFAAFFTERPPAGAGQFCNDRLSPHVRAHDEGPWEEPNLSIPVFLHAQRCCEPASRGLPQCSPRNEEEEKAAAAHCRDFFAAYVIRPRGASPRRPHRRLYQTSRPESSWPASTSKLKGRLTRWTLGIRPVSKAGDALPLFPTASVDTIGASGPAQAGGPTIKGQTDQGGTVRGPIENRLNAGTRNAPSAAPVGTPRTTPGAFTTTIAAATSSPTITGDHSKYEQMLCKKGEYIYIFLCVP